MDKEQIQTLSAEQISRSILEMSAEQVQQIIPNLSLEQVLASLSSLTPQKDPQWQSKVASILASILNVRWLEAAGRVLSPTQMQAMLDYCQSIDKAQQWKLSPLIVGMSPVDFAHLLAQATPAQMEMLKHEGMAEPMQFQLRTLSQEWLYALEGLCAIATGYEQEILNLNPAEIDSAQYHAFLQKFQDLDANFCYILEGINSALSVTWHTNRIDLIEKFGLAKEMCQKALIIIVGHPRTQTESPTGLYEFLERHLREVFGHPSDPDVLKDEDSPLEALGKFSIWHLEDYWEAGLLPKVAKKEGLHLDPMEFSEETCENHRRKLLSDVQKNLENLGLSNVRAFKVLGIWSPMMFKEYVAQHQELLK